MCVCVCVCVCVVCGTWTRASTQCNAMYCVLYQLFNLVLTLLEVSGQGS